MRIGWMLWYQVDRIPYRFRGKHRVVKKPTMKDLNQMKLDFLREEENMLILRHPYLTAEQSYGHMTEIRNQRINIVEKQRDQRNEKFEKRITIADRLNHLKVKEVWD